MRRVVGVARERSDFGLVSCSCTVEFAVASSARTPRPQRRRPAARGGGPNQRGLTIRAGIKSDLGTAVGPRARAPLGSGPRPAAGCPFRPPGRRARPARPSSRLPLPRFRAVRRPRPKLRSYKPFFRTFSGLEFGTFIHLFPPHLSGSHHLVSLHPRCTPRRATVSRAPSRLDSSRPDGTRGRSAFRSRHCTAHLCRRPRSVWPHNVARSALASSHRMRFVSR